MIEIKKNEKVHDSTGNSYAKVVKEYSVNNTEYVKVYTGNNRSGLSYGVLKERLYRENGKLCVRDR